MQNPDIQADLIARLQAQLQAPAGDFVTVEPAWQMSTLKDPYSQAPAAYVYLHAEGAAGDADPQTTCPRQRVSLVYGVYLVVSADDFSARAQDVRQALFGWVPSERHEPMALRSGERINNGAEGIGEPFVQYRQLWSVDTWLMSRNDTP